MHRYPKCIFILWFVAKLASVTCIFTPVVETSQGRVRGLRSVSGQNRFYGIPYAVSERFQVSDSSNRQQKSYFLNIKNTESLISASTIQHAFLKTVLINVEV